MSTFDTTFSTEEHGFPWANEFKGVDIVASWFSQRLLTNETASQVIGLVHGGPPLQLTADMLDITQDEVVDEMRVLVDSAGLAAGMCLTALDRHIGGKGPWKRKPGKKSRNFALLAARQFEVMGDWRWLLETASDMSRPDVAHIWDETSSLGELTTDVWWPRIRRRLADGYPVPLILYRSRWNPFDHHVVIARGGSESSEGMEARLDLYDPDHPGEDTHLTIDFRRLNSFHLGPRSVYGPGFGKVRGFKRVRSRRTQAATAAPRDLVAQLAAM